MELQAAIEQLHDRCAIYTSSATAARLLDYIGWNARADLSQAVLLEPCVGEGSILLEGVLRLLHSYRSHGRALTLEGLKPRIRSFELHPGAVAIVRQSLRTLLTNEGMSSHFADQLVSEWVYEQDFLLERPGRATHVAANPPYVRWKNLPPILARLYRKSLPPSSTNGDLSVAFLSKMQEWAGDNGCIAALTSDRWLFAQYGEAFLHETKSRGWTITVADERPSDPFMKAVGAYSAIVLLTRCDNPVPHLPKNKRENARAVQHELLARHGSLKEAGCIVRVGPALGAGRTFILEPDEIAEVEDELVRPFLERKDLIGSEVCSARLRVVVPYDRHGVLIDPRHWPRFTAWIDKRKEALAKRSHFRDKEQYWRTIDAVPLIWSSGPKLLMPELSNRPFVTLDRTDAIPAHSLYAIWPSEWPIKVLQRVLNAGLLDLTAQAEAPALKMGWMRFYKRFLMRTPLPKWSQLSEKAQDGLRSDCEAGFENAFRSLFGFAPLPISSA
ncbi:Eco57I restriction-modification methylase domain-containing protein [Phyllobacterium phragmitis]|uniref:Eco57I restriction-modification methylase domain-containing protein n=1 Tax=Phyllobacterium phragmitis TaxID=2670329 RepID=UPI0038B3B783